MAGREWTSLSAMRMATWCCARVVDHAVGFPPDTAAMACHGDSMEKPHADRKGTATTEVTSAELSHRFAALHAAGTFAVPNAWDAASAAVMADAGAVAIATTSSGISWSLGVPDGEHLAGTEMLAAVERIVKVVDVPVSADLESGYGSTPTEVAVVVGRVAAVGAVGANLEDSPGSDGLPLRSIAVQCERLAAAREAADRHVAGFILNARTDVYLAGVGAPGQRLALVVERARHYADAGADCLFVPRLTDPDAIVELVAASPLPLNVMLAPGTAPSVHALGALGVRRISVGSLIAQAAYSTAASLAGRLAEGATSGCAGTGTLAYAQLQGLLAPIADRR